LTDDLRFIQPSVWLAAIQYDWVGTENAFHDLTSEVSDDDLQNFCLKHIEDYKEEYPDEMNTQYELIYDEVRSIFGYYNMCYVDVEPVPFSWKPKYVIVNEPIVGVW
jgi:hypothetical protein